MPNKHREELHLALLCELVSDFPGGAVEPGESPDFIVRSISRATGIEFTEFHLPPAAGERPHQELQTLKNRVVAAAHRIHLESGGPALYVSVFFRNSVSLTKRSERSLAETIARAVSQTPAPPFPQDVKVAWESLPSEVVDISIRASFNGCDQIWSADAGGWVAPTLSPVSDDQGPATGVEH